MEFFFRKIGLLKRTISGMKEGDSHRIRCHSSARGVVKGIRDIRSGGLSRFMLCAGANRI